MKILYVAGTGRSGSTVLGRVLAESPGFFMAGELSRLWNRIVLGRDVCGCSERLADCPVWSPVFREAFGGFPGVDPHSMKARLDSTTRTRHLLRLLLRGQNVAAEAPVEELRRLYQAIEKITGCRVLVDTSKGPGYARFLAERVGLDVFVVHLVRDPRGVAFSWARPKPHPITGELMQRMTWAKSTVDWVVLNLLSEALDAGLGRQITYLRLLYEDFVDHPWQGIRQIQTWLGEPTSGRAAGESFTVELGRGHAVSGNPNRYDVGRMEIRADEEWRRRMHPARRLMVSALAWPVMIRYGYALRS
ncbi:MAG: sulfotransferase [Anaerolineales bacterium]